MARKIFTSWIGLKPTKVRKFSRRKQGSDSDIIDQNMRFSLCDQKKEEHGIPENRDIVCLLYRLVSNHHASYNTSNATSKSMVVRVQCRHIFFFSKKSIVP